MLLSYPQFRIVDNRNVGLSEFSTASVYPDFGLMRSAARRSPGGGGVAVEEEEEVRLLIEVKQLYREANGQQFVKTLISLLTFPRFRIALAEAKKYQLPS